MKNTVWQGKHLSVAVDDGWEFAERTNKLQAVVIVALDGDHVLLIEQERTPVGGRVLELPAGLVGDDTAGETVLDAAARELEEETGYRAASIEALGRYYSSPGLTSEAFTLVRATGLTRVGEGGGVGSEAITVHRVALSDVSAFVQARRDAGVGIDAKLLLFVPPSPRPA